jgi:tRNA dimethylallyltransferase
MVHLKSPHHHATTSPEKSKIIFLVGPTAIGKTEAAVYVAKKLKAEIISCDSMQIYKGMDIGTAKPSLEERQKIPHHLIDIVTPDQPFSVSDFIDLAHRAIKEIKDRKKTPIMVGGTGLYLWAFLEGYDFPITPANREIRERLKKESPENLYQRLQETDPKAASKIHKNDLKRIVRALEVFELTGKPISALQRKSEKIEATKIGLNMEREMLYQRIEQRINGMIDNGLVEEVKGLINKGYGRDLPSMQALGYKEVIDYLDGKCNFDEMVSLLKKNTRHFARRQMIWFRRFTNVKWFEVDKGFGVEDILPHIEM